MPAVGARSGTPASMSASEVPHTVAIDDEPFEFGDLRDDADGVGKLVVERQHRVDRAPGQLAVADFAASGCAEPAGLADRERRKIVVQQEGLLVGAVERIDELLVFAGAERRHHEGLGLAAGEQRRAVGARQQPDLGEDRAHRFHVAPVDAAAGVENVPAHDLGFEVLEDGGDTFLAELRIFRPRRKEMFDRLGLGGVDGLVPGHLVGNAIGGAQILLDEGEHACFERGIVGQRQLARLLGGFLGEADDRVDHRLEMPVAEHHGAEHDLLGQFLGFGLHHQHGIGRAGDDEIKIALGSSRRSAD